MRTDRNSICTDSELVQLGGLLCCGLAGFPCGKPAFANCESQAKLGRSELVGVIWQTGAFLAGCWQRRLTAELSSCFKQNCACQVWCWQSLVELLVDSVFTCHKRTCDLLMLECRKPASLYSGREEVGWGRLANEHWIFSYERWLDSARDGAEAATLSGMMHKYRLFLLCCGDCLFITVGGFHTLNLCGADTLPNLWVSSRRRTPLYRVFHDFRAEQEVIS
jgi:hypothetical protein